jgi:hypothetical protein
MAGATGPPLTSWQRFECKYLVPESVAAQVRAQLLPFLQPDDHAAAWPGFTYPVATLYLDGSDLHLYRQTVEGEKKRFKLRIRAYSDDPGVPVFAEIKRRHDGVVRKQRCPVPRATLAAVAAADAAAVPGLSPAMQAALDEFCRLVQFQRARPNVVVRYDREAYVAISARDTRVTFDRRLRALASDAPELPLRDGRMRPVPVPGVVLELKFTDRCPPWLLQVVQRFELRRISFSKYCRSVDRVGSMDAEAASQA